MAQDVQLAKILLYYSTNNVLLLVHLDITNQAQFAINAIALAILVLEALIQTVSLV